MGEIILKFPDLLRHVAMEEEWLALKEAPLQLAACAQPQFKVQPKMRSASLACPWGAVHCACPLPGRCAEVLDDRLGYWDFSPLFSAQ